MLSYYKHKSYIFHKTSLMRQKGEDSYLRQTIQPGLVIRNQIIRSKSEPAGLPVSPQTSPVLSSNYNKVSQFEIDIAALVLHSVQHTGSTTLMKFVITSMYLGDYSMNHKAIVWLYVYISCFFKCSRILRKVGQGLLLYYYRDCIYRWMGLQVSTLHSMFHRLQSKNAFIMYLRCHACHKYRYVACETAWRVQNFPNETCFQYVYCSVFYTI